MSKTVRKLEIYRMAENATILVKRYSTVCAYRDVHEPHDYCTHVMLTYK